MATRYKRRVSKMDLLDTRCYLMESILHINQREKILAQLAKQLLLEPGSRNIYHGRIYNYILPPPEATWISADPPKEQEVSKMGDSFRVL